MKYNPNPMPKGITTIAQVREIISRTNQRLETVRWVLQPSDGGYRLTKWVQKRDIKNRKYWWAEKIMPAPSRAAFLALFRNWCRKNRRDTLSKAAYTHEDYISFIGSRCAGAEQTNLFEGGDLNG